MFGLLILTSIVLTGVVVFLTRALAHPATMMMGIWAIVLTGLYLLREDYLEMDVLPLAFLFSTSTVFALAALVTQGKVRRGVVLPPMPVEQAFRTVLLPFALVSLAVVPFYVRQQLSVRGRSANVLFNIRESGLDAGGSFFFDNFYLVVLIASLFSLYNFLINRRVSDLLIYIALISSGLTLAVFSGAKGEVINIIFASFVLYIILYPRRQFFAGMIIAVSLFTLLLAGLFFINLAGDSNSYDFTFVRLLATDYVFGGAAAFAIYYNEIINFQNQQTFINAYASFLRAVGFSIPDFSIHYPFVNLYGYRYTNVYTWMFPIIKQFGMLGAFTIAGLLGGLAGLVYRISRRSFTAMCCYVVLSLSIVQSIFSDLFLYGSFRFLKLLVFIVLFNFFIRWVAQFYWNRTRKEERQVITPN